MKQQNDWIELLDATARPLLRDLLDATERRYKELDRTKPPAFLLYVDQGEELYVRAEERQRRRFSEVIAQGVADPRLYMLMSMRADFLGELQKDEPLYKVHRQIDVPPLREAELREVVSRPAELLSARFETAGLADIITRRTAEDSVKDVGALPLLSYTLDDMWTQMVKRDDGVLRLPAQSFELGGVLVDRADAFLAAHPKSQDELRRIFTLKLATVREGEEPTRRRALRSEFTDEEWRLVSELADHPNRLLVTATPEGGETYAEVAHEAIFRRWGKLRDWIAAEREFLAWKTGLEAARRAWQATPDSSKNDALLMGLALAQGQSWLAKRPADIPEADREFVVLSRKAAQRRRLRVRALIGVLTFAIVAAGLGVRGLELVEGDVAEARVVDIGRDRSRAVGGPERAGDEARPRWVLRGELIGCRARELRRLEVELVNEVLQAVVRLRDRGRVEGIGLDHVGARREVLQVDSPYDPGLRQHQQVVVAPEVLRMVGEALSTIVRLREPAALDHGAERPVQDQNALPEQGVELCSTVSHKRWGKWCKTLMQKAVILRQVAGKSGLRL